MCHTKSEPKLSLASPTNRPNEAGLLVPKGDGTWRRLYTPMVKIYAVRCDRVVFLGEDLPVSQEPTYVVALNITRLNYIRIRKVIANLITSVSISAHLKITQVRIPRSLSRLRIQLLR